MSNLKHTLYGDGVHDDFLAIQELIDSGKCEISLPVPEKCYLISKTLTLPSNFKLTLPRFAEIKLMDGASCPMVSNKMIKDKGERILHAPSDLCRALWYFVNEYSPEIMSQNIEIEGGIWNFNNQNQLGNPEQTHVYEPYGYTGDGMLFYGVRGFKMAHMTFKDPVHYGAVFDRVSYFTMEDITFDYNYGNPIPLNMDGLHFNGNCHYGHIRNLKGRCFDDLVALNAHEGSRGPITNIEIDGLFAEDCHSAVRLLTVGDDVKSIHISNVYGTYYQYCIGLTKYYPGETTGVFDGITLDHIYAAKGQQPPYFRDRRDYVYPLIFLQDGVRIKGLTVNDLHRAEYTKAVETVLVGQGTEVDYLILRNISLENHVGEPFPVFRNRGRVKHLHLEDIRTDGDEVWCNTPSGSVEKVMGQE